MTKIIIVNGPPDCGKDEAVSYLKRKYGVHAFSFKTELKALTLKLYCVSEALWDSWYTRVGKELPRTELEGLSCRQALIRVSEMIVKPNFGKGYFGKAEGIKLKALSDAGQLLAACSDGGFNEEIDPLIDIFGEDSIHILKIERPDRSFEGDSRNWINHPRIPVWNYWYISNSGPLDQYWSDLDTFWELGILNRC
jgi:hypothetical protein